MTPSAAPAVPRREDAAREKVSIRDLQFYYGDGRALKDITLPLYDRKVTAFIGPSGCGKSTLLRVLNRMYDLYPGQRAEGEALLDGENILSPKQDLNLLRSRTGMASVCRAFSPTAEKICASAVAFAMRGFCDWRIEPRAARADAARPTMKTRPVDREALPGPAGED